MRTIVTSASSLLALVLLLSAPLHAMENSGAKRKELPDKEESLNKKAKLAQESTDSFEDIDLEKDLTLDIGAFFKQEELNSQALYAAVKANNLEQIKQIMQSETDMYSNYNEAGTALHYAIKQQNIDAASLLAQDKKLLEAKNNQGQTALHLAVLNGYDAFIHMLIASGAKVNKIDDYKQERQNKLLDKLYGAIYNNNLDALQQAYNDGADIYTAYEYRYGNNSASSGPALNFAVECANLEAIDWLISLDKNLPTYSNKTGHTATHVGIYDANKDTLEYLLTKTQGIGIDVQNKWGETPLYCATHMRASDKVEALLENNAKVDGHNYNGENLMHAVIRVGEWDVPTIDNGLIETSIDIIHTLLKHKVDINAQDKNGNTSLHYALDFNKNETPLEIITCLIENGADINAQNNSGETPLHTAIASGHSQDVIDYIINQGADVDAVITKENATPLHYAVDYFYPNALKILLKYNADISIRDAENSTPLIHANLLQTPSNEDSDIDSSDVESDDELTLDEQRDINAESINLLINAYGNNNLTTYIKELKLKTTQDDRALFKLLSRFYSGLTSLNNQNHFMQLMKKYTVNNTLTDCNDKLQEELPNYRKSEVVNPYNDQLKKLFLQLRQQCGIYTATKMEGFSDIVIFTKK